MSVGFKKNYTHNDTGNDLTEAALMQSLSKSLGHQSIAPASLFDIEKIENMKKNIQDDFSLMNNVFGLLQHVLENTSGIYDLQKSLNIGKVPKAKPTKIVRASYSGHVGTGVRPAARHNQVADITISTAPTSTTPAGFLGFPGDKSVVNESKENWKNHPNIHVGSFVFVKHPYKHEMPEWCRVLAVGSHGVSVKNIKGSEFNIRWPNIHNAQTPVGNDDNAQELVDTLLELFNMGVPMAHDKIDDRDKQHAHDFLREIKIPIDEDLLHHDHEDRDDIYDYLKQSGIPIDPIHYTLVKDSKFELPEHLLPLAEELQKKGIPIDIEKLSSLSKNDILKVLKHHFSDLKSE